MQGAEVKHRAVELKPKKEQVNRALDENPNLTSTELSEMAGVSKSTVAGWKSKHQKRSIRQVSVDGLTWQQVLNACPEVDVLGVLLVQGFIRQSQEQQERIAELEKQAEWLTKDRQTLMREHNHLLLQAKSDGHLTIDTAQQQLIPKPR